MNNSYYSGSSYYDEEDVSMRSDPPLLVQEQEELKENEGLGKIPVPKIPTPDKDENNEV